MTEESKYVLRHEWVDSNGKIYEKINQNEIKYNEKFAELNSKIEKQTDIAVRSLESQKRQEKYQEKLNNTMEKFGNDFVEIRYKVEKHDEKIQSFQSVIEEKQKGNVQITVAFIALIPAVIGFAYKIADYFF